MKWYTIKLGLNLIYYFFSSLHTFEGSSRGIHSFVHWLRERVCVCVCVCVCVSEGLRVLRDGGCGDLDDLPVCSDWIKCVCVCVCVCVCEIGRASCRE